MILSVSASISHSFSFSEVLGKDDMLIIAPQLSLIGGMQSYSTVSRSTVIGTRTREVELDRIRKLYNVSSTDISSFNTTNRRLFNQHFVGTGKRSLFLQVIFSPITLTAACPTELLTSSI